MRNRHFHNFTIGSSNSSPLIQQYWTAILWFSFFAFYEWKSKHLLVTGAKAFALVLCILANTRNIFGTDRLTASTEMEKHIAARNTALTRAPSTSALAHPKVFLDHFLGDICNNGNIIRKTAAPIYLFVLKLYPYAWWRMHNNLYSAQDIQNYIIIVIGVIFLVSSTTINYVRLSLFFNVVVQLPLLKGMPQWLQQYRWACENCLLQGP